MPGFGHVSIPTISTNKNKLGSGRSEGCCIRVSGYRNTGVHPRTLKVGGLSRTVQYIPPGGSVLGWREPWCPSHRFNRGYAYVILVTGTLVSGYGKDSAWPTHDIDNDKPSLLISGYRVCIPGTFTRCEHDTSGYPGTSGTRVPGEACVEWKWGRLWTRACVIKVIR